ncbi:hypothetical protein PHMEG_00015982 [Phytophthora megakarya]|uniref:Uncharacterized protein n=1 Tax=Phytophthora megakarya TaxID=4795 RepID=A0A225W2F8_9STRA|nr:hypothetical protein PHMEG_00015982 [Phytophthora megakarya]
MPTMAVSMADHLLAQEYSLVRNASSMVLTELRVPKDGVAQLEEVYERNDTSPEEYLSLITAQPPFTPSLTRHAVIINAGSYCMFAPSPSSSSPGNPAIKQRLWKKIPSGGVLLHVRSLDEAPKLTDQVVMGLGRKFIIKRPSVFLNKLYLDVSGIHSADKANQLFLALCALGIRPFFMTPRDLNMKAQVGTSTWRFYFGCDTAPANLQVHGYVTNQLALGSHFYVTRGKQSTPPPAQATTFRRSRYAVALPLEAH